MVELGCFCGIDWFLVVVGCFSSFNELVEAEYISRPFISSLLSNWINVILVEILSFKWGLFVYKIDCRLNQTCVDCSKWVFPEWRLEYNWFIVSTYNQGLLNSYWESSQRPH